MMPKQVVLDHIVKFNNCDIEGCLRFVANDIEVTLLNENKVLFREVESLREHLKSSFEDEDYETVEVLKLIEMGNYITTLEEKTSQSTKSKRRLTVVYLVENDKISKMWAIKCIS